MADDEDRPPGASTEMLRRNWMSFENLIRLAERIAMAQHPVDEAQTWAESTLRKAGLPTTPGLYAPDTDGGLLPVPQPEGARFLTPDPDADYPWQLTLHEAILRLPLGLTRTSPEHLAAKLLNLRAQLAHEIEKCNVDQIAGTACMIGRLHMQGQDQKLAKARVAQRAAGKKSAEARGYTPREKGLFVLRRNELKREYEKKGEERTDTYLADEVAREFHVPETTMRKLLPLLLNPRSRRKRGRPKKTEQAK